MAGLHHPYLRRTGHAAGRTAFTAARPSRTLAIPPLEWCVLGSAIVFVFCVAIGAAEPGATLDRGADAARREIAGLVQQLNSDRFEARQQAVSKLQAIKTRPGAGPVLAEEFRRVLLSAETPFEVRRQVERLQAGLPAVDEKRLDSVPKEEIGRLMRQLEDDRYGVRLGAKRRLEWLLGDPKLVSAIYGALKERLGEPELSLDARQWITPICVRARMSWLTSDPATWDLPAVSESQIRAWVDELAQPAAERGPTGRPPTRQHAMQELRDLLARDEYEAKVVEAVESRLTRNDADPQAVRRLQDLLDLTRPAMVAEFWQSRRHVNTQHLVIGVPSRTPGADRASHFDFIDDDTAFCVSGQNLSPGNYPVGVAIPHPRSLGAMFHLVNLSRPRHKMVYECLTSSDQGRRLAEITRRTLARFLASHQRMSVEELMLLEQLDPDEVSRFAGPYFLAVDDQVIPDDVLDASLGRPMLPSVDPSIARPMQAARVSRHGAICCVLAASGTREAVPGLLAAIDKGRFAPPGPKAPYRLPWIAALAIASRDPWPECDAWLCQIVGRTELLVLNRDRGPDLGATAAGVLLARSGLEPIQFGLNEVDDPLFESIDLTGYRFESPNQRERVRQWSSGHRAENQP